MIISAVSQELRDLIAITGGHRGSHKFTDAQKASLQAYWNELSGKVKPLNWGCSSCVNAALKSASNYIKHHEVKQAMQPKQVSMESMERKDLIELAKVKGLEFPKNIKTDRLIQLIKNN